MAEQMNLYQKLAKIRKQVEVVQKNKAGYGYKYVTDDELLAKITAGMDKHGVSLIPHIVPGTMVVEPYTYTKTKGGKQETVNEFISHGDMKYVWINNDNPDEKISVDWCTIGQQSDASQCLGSGLTYSMRYFLLKYFNVATPDDDPDAWRSKQKEAEDAEDKALAEKTIGVFDKVLREYLAANSKNAGEVKKFVTGYVKSGDYFKISDPDLAVKLLEDFNKKFIKED